MTNKKIFYCALFIAIATETMVKNIAIADPICNSLPISLKNKPLTLIELSDIALNCNPATRIDWAQIKMSLANLGINYSRYWPQLSGTYNYSSNKKSFKQSTINYNGQRQITYGSGISLNYLIWDFGVRTEQVRAADFQLQAAKLTQNSTFQQIILQVEQAYYQLIWQKALVLSAKDSVKENRVNLKTAKALRKRGKATVGDVYQAKSALGQAELTLEQAKGALKIIQGQLASTIGLSVQTPITLINISNQVKTETILQSMKELLKFAKENRPDFLAMEAKVKAAAAQLVATTRQDWPTLGLTTNIQRTYSKNLLLNNKSNGIDLTINIPLFSGFSRQYMILQAQAQQEQLEAQKDNLAQQIDFQVWQYYFALQTAAKSIASNQKILKSSIQAAKQVHGQYKVGVGKILDVLTTQATLANARTQLIQAKLNWYTTLAQLSIALGKINMPINKPRHK